jgi:hypothetical protein
MSNRARHRPTPWHIVVLATLLVMAGVSPALAQETMRDALTFLLTNRSIVTNDFERDTLAAERTRDALVTVLGRAVGTIAVPTSGSGFVYRFNADLGSFERASATFGGFFVDRALTIGRGRTSFTVTYDNVRFDAIDGRDLTDGTLVATASRLRGDAAAFDAETLELHLRASRVIATGHVGLADHLELGVAVPIVTLRMDGERVDTYRSVRTVQAIASASATGLGDMIVRAKYAVWTHASDGLSVGGEFRLPTGDADQLLGTGAAAIKPRVIGSLERQRVAVHGEAGYVFGEITNGLEYGGAVTVAAHPAFTVAFELLSQQRGAAGEVTTVVEPHPTLVGVDTVRLTALEDERPRTIATFGFKWNVASTWLVAFNVSRALTSAGLTGGWAPAVTVDYSFVR